MNEENRFLTKKMVKVGAWIFDLEGTESLNGPFKFRDLSSDKLSSFIALQIKNQVPTRKDVLLITILFQWEPRSLLASCIRDSEWFEPEMSRIELGPSSQTRERSR